MPVKAEFRADFKSFLAAVDAADVKLADFGKGAAQVETKLTNMVDRFSGRKLIQEATLTAEAIERMGGVSKLTGDELEGVGRQADAAIAKLSKLGMDIPPGLVKISDAAKGAGTSTSALAEHAKAFDNVLQQVGITIQPVTKAIDEIAGAAGQSATSLGVLGTAGLAVGAAYAGWNVGRMIADFFDLDDAIATASAALLGFGDVGAETAAAKADTLARASKVAGFEVLTMSTAMQVLNNQAKDHAASLDTIERRTATWHAEMTNAGVSAEALTKDLASQVYSVDDLAKKYGVSVGAINNFTREQTASAAATEKAADKIAAANARKIKDQQALIDAAKPFKDAMVELQSAGDGWKGTLDTIDGTVVEGIKHYLQAGVSLKALADAYGLTDTQVKAVAASLKADADATARLAAETEALTKAHAAEIAALDKETDARKRATAEKKKEADAIEAAKRAKMAEGGSTEYDVSTAAGRAKVPEDIRTWLHVGYSLEQAARLAYALKMGFDISRDPLFATKGPAVPGFAGGVDNFRGGLAVVGERGPELVNLPPGSSVFPMTGTGAGRGDTYNFYLVDNTESLARKVSHLIMAGTRGGGKVGL